MLPLVSIIIPCYNAEKYVAEAIQSALDQTYPNCEIIVIDDGSTDGSLEVIKSFGDKIRWETGPNRGGCAARNRGLELSGGEWIQFLDADDFISKEKVEKQMVALSVLPEDCIASCSWMHFEGSQMHELRPEPFWKNYPASVDFLRDMWSSNCMMPPHCWLVPKKLIDRIGGWNIDLVADQDGEYFGRVLIAAKKLVFVGEAEAYYRLPQTGNVSQSNSVMSIHSRAHAFQILVDLLFKERQGYGIRRAVLRRLRTVAYRARKYPDIIKVLAMRERELKTLDFQFSQPLGFNLLCGFIGIERALALRAKLQK